MKLIKITGTLMYFALNAFLGSLVFSLFSGEPTSFSAMSSLPAILIGAALVFLDRSLPWAYNRAQVGLSLLLITLQFLAAGPMTKYIVLGLMLVIIGLKLMAMVGIIRRIKDFFTGRSEVNAAHLSGDKFYSSQAWRKLRYKILVEQGKRCANCKTRSINKEYHVDHIKPRSLYPHLALDPKNMQVLCKDCNLGKSNKWEVDHRLETA